MRDRHTYRLMPALDDKPGRVDLIPCTDGTLGYLRIENGDGKYVGCLERGALRCLARAIENTDARAARKDSKGTR